MILQMILLFMWSKQVNVFLHDILQDYRRTNENGINNKHEILLFFVYDFLRDLIRDFISC
jgi:hypothetical protein